MSKAPHSQQKETFVVNLGPQHPATHGVLRITLEMDGEYIVEAYPVLGYSHRMHEKMGENRTWAQFLPNMGRLDYLGPLSFNHGYVLTVERAMGIEVPERAEYIRVITAELGRVASHLFGGFGAYVIDLGGFTPMLYAFQDREMVLDLLEAATGARLTFCYFRFGGVYNDISDDFISGTREFIKWMRTRVPMYHNLATKNYILMRRMKDIGFVDAEMCRKYGATGPVLRGCGVEHDVRKAEPYSVYPQFDFDIPVHSAGDCMARYLVRLDEILESLRIIEQALDKLPEGPVMAPKVPKNLKPAKGDYVGAVESPRGTFMVRTVSDGTNQSYRMRLRSPSYSNLSLFSEASRGLLLADAISLLGSLDLVIPEMDR